MQYIINQNEYDEYMKLKSGPTEQQANTDLMKILMEAEIIRSNNPMTGETYIMFKINEDDISQNIKFLLKNRL